MSRSVADWVKKLKPGSYLMKDLIQITNLTPSYISRQLIKYGVKVEVFKKYRNLNTYLYHWEGYKGDD